MTNYKLYRKADILSTLTDSDIEFIATRSREEVYKKGDIIFTVGAAAIHFYIIVNGAVTVTQFEDQNQAIDLACYIDGDSFGEFDFMTSALYQVEAKAIKETKLLVFPALPHTLESLTQEHPESMTRIYLRTLAFLSSRLRSIHSLISENTSWIKQLQDQLFTDHLTGLYTKMYLETEIPRLLVYPVSILMVKPDKFKTLNDIFGHKAGDAVLVRISKLFRDMINKKKGWAVRIRSNETALVFLETNNEEALDFAKIISGRISQIGPSQISESKHKKQTDDFILTASIAVGTIDSKKYNWKQIYDLTYDLMYQAWKKGGNRILLLKNE